MEMTYTKSDIKKLVSESSNEFKAVLGPKVESENKSNNGKAYRDAAKEHYGKELKAPEIAKYEKTDDNGTLLDYSPDNEISKEQQKKNTTIAQGYNSEAEKSNGLKKEADFDKNKDIIDAFKKSSDEHKKNKATVKGSGLTGRELKKADNKVFDENDLVAESKDGFDMRQLIDTFRANEQKSFIKEEKSLKTVFFKKTTFLSEGHMISRIPDEFKNEGAQFKMKDKTGNEYIVEWKNNTGKILNHSNKEGMNESVSRMKSLYGYTTVDSQTNQSYRLNEGDDKFKDTLDKMRRIIK